VPAPRLPILLRTLLAAALCGALWAPARAQTPGQPEQPGQPEELPPPALEEPNPAEQFEDRPIYEVIIRRPGEQPGEFVPLDPRREELARNQIGSRPGAPLSGRVISDDLAKLNRLGEFGEIEAAVEQVEGGWVRIIYTVTPQPKILAVGFSGNNEISNEDLHEVAGQRLEGAPVNDEAIQQAARDLQNHYRSKGFGLAEVTAATEDLEDTGTLYFIIVEGLRVRITGVRFVGNSVLGARELRSAVRARGGGRERVVLTRPRDMFGILEKGRLDTQMVARDEASLAQYYKDRGYLDARVGHRLVYAPNGREVIVEFLITEGERYTVGRVEVVFEGIEGDEARFDAEQIRGLIPLKAGEVYSEARLQESVNAIYAAYVELGYVECFIDRAFRTARDAAIVDLEFRVSEGPRFKMGELLIQGNDFTRMEVILRDVMLRPGRWLSGHVDHDRRRVAGSAQDETERRLERSGLFGPQQQPEVRVTIQPPDRAEPEYRDVLVEVEETDTGAAGVGASVSSDLGVLGRITLRQRNFDIADTPDSIGELLTGRAFRGAGQTADLTLEPGNTYQQYAASFLEPHLLETDYSLSLDGSYRAQQFRDFDEVRFGGTISVGRNFGTRWRGAMSLRAQQVGIFSIDEDGPVDFFDAEGYNSLLGLGVRLSRETFDHPVRPSRGTRIAFRAEQVFTADDTFTKLGATHLVYITLYEDAIGSRTTLALRTQADWIPQDQQDVPFYERYTQGGAGFRGFGVRGIGPVGVRNDTGEPGGDQVGGVWSFFWGAELQQPLTNNIAIAFFMDTGTVEDTVSFDHYRLSVGTGLRLFIPQLSPAPLALDFGFPIIKEPTDDTRIFTFTIDIPF
jgi:outer membrane protein insertion porin family